jgi:hypothetical protein
MLSFTDNRQDASLLAGHFNDFIEVGVLRSALYGAVKQAGAEGLRHEELTQTEECFGFVREINRSLGKNTSVSNERAIRLSRAAHTTSLREWRQPRRVWDDTPSVQVRRSPRLEP